MDLSGTLTRDPPKDRGHASGKSGGGRGLLDEVPLAGLFEQGVVTGAGDGRARQLIVPPRRYQLHSVAAESVGRSAALGPSFKNTSAAPNRRS